METIQINLKLAKKIKIIECVMILVRHVIMVGMVMKIIVQNVKKIILKIQIIQILQNVLVNAIIIIIINIININAQKMKTVHKIIIFL